MEKKNFVCSSSVLGEIQVKDGAERETKERKKKRKC